MLNKCNMCGFEDASEVFQPIQSYESHIEIRFFIHHDLEGEQNEQVPMCRKCAILIANNHLSVANPERITFYA